MIRERGTGYGEPHSLDNSAVSARPLPPEAAAGDTILRFHEWDDFLPQIVVVSARPGRVDILVPADPGEAVDQRDDHRAHLSGSDEAVELRGQVLAEWIDPEEHLPGARVSDDPVRGRIAFRRIVFRRQVDSDVAFRRVPQRVALQHSRVERLDDDLPAGHANLDEGSRTKGIKASAFQPV